MRYLRTLTCWRNRVKWQRRSLKALIWKNCHGETESGGYLLGSVWCNQGFGARRKKKGNVRLNRGIANLPKTSVVVVSQIATIDKSRVLEKIGTLDKKNMEEIIHGCQWVINLSPSV